MPDPVTLSAGISWGVSAAGWLISPVVSRLVNKCFDALDLDPQFQSRKKALDNKLEHLRTTLLPQLLILTDAAQKCQHRGELENWLQKLKSAYYEAEHLLGLVEYKRLEKVVNHLFPTASKFSFKFNLKFNFWEMKLGKRDLLKGLVNLEKVINEAMKFVKVLNLSVSIGNNSVLRSTEQSRETLSTPVFTIIGRDRDRDHILKLLRNDFPNCSKCYSVIAIWGMGGSGKTTLAQYVCEYEKKSGYFNLVIWTYVSQNFNLHSIFKRIWESAFPEDCPKCDSIEGLSSKLREKLRGKRFFLVLDDVWCDKDASAQELEQLFSPLQNGERGSKILVTTRIEEAAKTLGAINPIPLRQLEHDEYLDLFLSRALCNLQDSDKHLEERLIIIGKVIANKLHRSPLAATTVAAQLCKRLDPDFWLSMCEQNLLNETMGALLLSYQNLPPALQRCFAFCSLFPKGHKFSQDRLVGLWIGEDFIETEDSNRHVRDIGNEYMLELISSSFLQVDKDIYGDTKYSLHDLLHDLAEKVSNCDCFRIECDEKTDIPIHIRHLYVEAHMFGEYIEKICKLKDLRTIIFGSRAKLKEEDLNTLFKRSKKLYVVDLYNCFINGWPEYVLTLKNLRYLNCGASGRTKFPKPSSTGFYQLRLLHFPKPSSTGFYQLRLLHGYYERRYPNIQIPNVGRLTLLQDLTVFKVRDVRGCGLEQLEHLRDLYGELVIYNLKNVNNSQEACRVKLFDKKGLRALELWWTTPSLVDISDSDSWVIDSCNPNEIEDAEDILDALCPPPQLEKLSIQFLSKRCPKWFSGYNKNATHLKELHLFRCPFLEALPETNKLIHLQSLTISYLPRLKSWESLPSNLVKLILFRCDSLAFISVEDLKIRMSTQSGEPSPIDRELEKLMPEALYDHYLDRQAELDRICQLKEVNGELYLPLTLQELKMTSCFISNQILASSLKGHTSLTHLELYYIIPTTCIPREVLGSLINLRFLRIRACLMLTSVGGLNTLSSLEVLDIEECPCLTIESLDMSNSKLLSSLSLSMCPNLVSLMELNELNNLENLTVVGCDKLQCSSDANKLPGLKQNQLTISKLSILDLISRNGLSSLVSLTIKKAEQECFTQEECEMLSHLSSLEKIRFHDCKMQSLPDLSCLKSLTILKICRCRDLISLSELPPSVQFISICCCTAEFTRSCKDCNHPNCQKIFHIPKKCIYGDSESSSEEE